MTSSIRSCSEETILQEIATIAREIQQSQDLDLILQTAIARIRTLLQTDRVLIYRILADQDAVVAFEAVGAAWTSVLGQLIYDPCLAATWIERYRQGQITTIPDINHSAMNPCYGELLHHLQVQANVVVPLLVGERLWALLIVHHCQSPREWQPLEIQYLQQITLQLGLAIQQAELRQSYQQLLAQRERPSGPPDPPHAGATDGDSANDGDRLNPASRALQESAARFSEIADTIPQLFKEDLIQNIAQGVSARTGDAFFHSLVAYLIRLLDMDQAFIGELLPPHYDRIKIIAGSSHDQTLVGFEYALAGTPCETIVEQGFCLYPDQIQQRFPDTSTWPTRGGEGYAGIPLIGSTGAVIGIMGVRSQQAIAQGQFIEKGLTIFAGRAASELEQRQSEAQLRRYERIVSATSDCVSLVDRNYIYQVVNQTYLNWHQKSYDAIVGHSVSDLFGLEFFESTAKPYLDRCLAGVAQQVLETWLTCRDGQHRYTQATYTPYIELDGTIAGVVVNVHDLTELKRAETALAESHQLYQHLVENSPDIIERFDRQLRHLYVSPTLARITGLSTDSFTGKTCRELGMDPGMIRAWETAAATLLATGQRQVIEFTTPTLQGIRAFEMAIAPEFSESQTIESILCISRDITDRQAAEISLRQQAERERLLAEIAQHIRQTLDLNQILYTTVTEVRQFLQVDRAIIYRFETDWSGSIIAESVADGWRSILGMKIIDTYFVETQGYTYQEGHVHATSDIYTNDLNPCHIGFLEKIQVRAKLVVPILQNNHLWGLLVAQHCQSPRQWQEVEVELLQQLATQITIAIQQSELYQQVQTLNMSLEQQVQERTAQLQQALEFEALLKRITDQVRDSLDEGQILQTVVRELAIALNAECCDASIYDSDRTTPVIQYEYAHGAAQVMSRDNVCPMLDNPDSHLYGECFQAYDCQFCLIQPNVLHPEDLHRSTLACPIIDDQDVLGDLWLFKPAQDLFTDQEVRLVQQVANQCAIALRQCQLYQAAQTQVQELEQLNQLKDDFLNTVSHELRSPMSSISLATQMLETLITTTAGFTELDHPVHRYLKILRDEGDREMNLINDLLDLARLDAGIEPLNLTTIKLQFYIPYVTESFVERTQQQQQHFVIQIPDDLPELTTDLPYLERIITELLHNACKYTPAGETITVFATETAPAIALSVRNSGVEIPAAEHDRVFDKFYRIPNNDPWKHGGTGLGLALVKKMADQLGATIHLDSANQQTTFTLTLPT